MQSTDPSRPAASVPASECPSPPVQRPALSIEACPTAGVLTSERATPSVDARPPTSVGAGEATRTS